jgi:hypothetical protein
MNDLEADRLFILQDGKTGREKGKSEKSFKEGRFYVKLEVSYTGEILCWTMKKSQTICSRLAKESKKRPEKEKI